jgi:hypothetical protein
VYKPTHTQVFSSASHIANASVLNSIQRLPLSKPKIVQIQPNRTGSISTIPQLSQTNKSPVPSIPRNVGHGRGKSVDDVSQVTEHVSGLSSQGKIEKLEGVCMQSSITKMDVLHK